MAAKTPRVLWAGSALLLVSLLQIWQIEGLTTQLKTLEDTAGQQQSLGDGEIWPLFSQGSQRNACLTWILLSWSPAIPKAIKALLSFIPQFLCHA